MPRSSSRRATSASSAVPAADHLADRRRDLGIGPAGGDHLLEDPDVAGLDVGVEEVAGELPADPQRLRRVEHRALAFEEPVVLGGEDGQDELALRSEVVVDLAERDAGRLGHGPGREIGVAVGEQAVAGGGQDRARGCRPWPDRGARRAWGPPARSVRPCAEHTTRGSRGDRVDGGQDEQRPPAAGSGDDPGAGSSRRRSGRRGPASPSGCRARRRTSRASATSSSRRRTRRGRGPSQRLAPLGRAAPAVHDEAERAAALVEAAVAQRAELPQAGDERAWPR